MKREHNFSLLVEIV